MKDMELAYVRQLLDEHDSRDATINQSLVLRDFRREVEAAIPGCRTTPRNTYWAWVYMPEDHIAMGAIGIWQFSQNGRGSSAYAVHSRTITNGKYHRGSKQHRMMMSGNRSVAVKNAKKFLRRLSPHELVTQTSKHVRDAIGQMRIKAREVVTQKEATLFGTNLHGRKNAPILAELKHLVDMGHTFLDASIADQLREYFVFAAENDEVHMPYPMLFVSITQSGGKQRFDAVPIKDAASLWPDLGEPETFYDDVPEHVLGRLAVLSMVEIGTFVPGVGLKHTEGLFYVAR